VSSRYRGGGVLGTLALRVGLARAPPLGGVLPVGGGLCVFGLLLVVCVFFVVGVGSAFAGGVPRLLVHVVAAPSSFSEVDNGLCFANENSEPAEFKEAEPCDQFDVVVTNVGGGVARGPFVLSDRLPAGLRVGVSAHQGATSELFVARNNVDVDEGELPEGEPLGKCESQEAGGLVRCEFSEDLPPDERLELDVRVEVEPGAVSGAENLVEVFEAGTRAAVSESADVVNAGDVSPGFGPDALLALISGEDGLPDTQAGDHPYEFVTEFDMGTFMGQGPETQPRLVATTGGGGVRDVVVDLPVGFVGSAQATPKCTLAQLQSFEQCPSDSLVGHLDSEPSLAIDANSPVYNLVPERGVALELGFVDNLHGTHVIDGMLAPTPSGYVARAVAREVPYLLVWDVITTIFGDPSARNGGAGTPAAMFTNPSDCSGEPLRSSVYVDSWEHPGSFNADGTPDVEGPGSSGWARATSESAPVTGCNALRFDPSMTARPDTGVADSPTGLSFALTVPQSESPGTLGTPPLREATVSMPAGMTVDPSAASGLQACSEAQIGWDGASLDGQALANRGLTNFSEAAPTCPEASKIGEVQVTTPLLEKPVVGSVYLAAQDENPFGSLLGLYVVIDDPTTGTIVKLPGKLEANATTGQLTSVFQENPQFPFSELKLRLFGGGRGELATPQSCGTFTTNSTLLPWSSPVGSGLDATPSSSFQISSGCALGFAPSFSAGTEDNQAGAFSPLTVTIARRDGEQHLTGITVTTPPGLLGSLKGIPLCGEAQANAGTCGAGSLIGEATVSSGVGPEPYVVHGGRVYLTGPYNNGPFGLSVVVPAVAGPFDLGNVVVRSSIRVNPTTGQITVVSDPLPLMVDSVEGLKSGIPADVREIQITTNRKDFMFNPTNCSPLEVTGSLTAANGASVPVASHFEAANCATLPFHPVLEASTEGKASKAGGASLRVRVTSSQGQANIAKTDLTLPLQLPSRLSTIQKACLAAVFEANPAGCDEGSVIGTATAYTPVLNTPLTGPAYLVSHGGAAFPDVEFVLQGEGVTLILDGKTDIKKGITYSRFETIPDAPVETFETILPTGPHSALATNIPEHADYNLCGRKLRMPTVITGQNGAVINQTTNITITGCPSQFSITNKTLNTKHHTLTLEIYIPRAGKLKATGKTITPTTKTTTGQELITLKLHINKTSKHTTIKLTYTPTKNHTQTKTLTTKT
jgi:hypothetical protein